MCIAGVFLFDNLYFAEKNSLLVRDKLVNFEDILPESNKLNAVCARICVGILT